MINKWEAQCPKHLWKIQYIPRNVHTVFCFAVLCCGYTLIFPYPSGLLHWHCGNLTIAPVPAKQPWWIWINTSCEFIMNDFITTTKQSTTKPCAYFLGYTVHDLQWHVVLNLNEWCIELINQNLNLWLFLGSVRTLKCQVVTEIPKSRLPVSDIHWNSKGTN